MNPIQGLKEAILEAYPTATVSMSYQDGRWDHWLLAIKDRGSVLAVIWREGQPFRVACGSEKDWNERLATESFEVQPEDVADYVLVVIGSRREEQFRKALARTLQNHGGTLSRLADSPPDHRVVHADDEEFEETLDDVMRVHENTLRRLADN